jgi:hypothetical protein
MPNKLIEYIKLHKLSLEQDLDDARNDVPLNENEYYESDMYYEGAIDALSHILRYAFDEHYDNVIG